jgi:hypothetical protein
MGRPICCWLRLSFGGAQDGALSQRNMGSSLALKQSRQQTFPSMEGCPAGAGWSQQEYPKPQDISRRKSARSSPGKESFRDDSPRGKLRQRPFHNQKPFLHQTCLRDHPVRLRLPTLRRGEFKPLHEAQSFSLKQSGQQAFPSVEGCPAGAGWSQQEYPKAGGYFQEKISEVVSRQGWLSRRFSEGEAPSTSFSQPKAVLASGMPAGPPRQAAPATPTQRGIQTPARGTVLFVKEIWTTKIPLWVGVPRRGGVVPAGVPTSRRPFPGEARSSPGKEIFRGDSPAEQLNQPC